MNLSTLYIPIELVKNIYALVLWYYFITKLLVRKISVISYYRILISPARYNWTRYKSSTGIIPVVCIGYGVINNYQVYRQFAAAGHRWLGNEPSTVFAEQTGIEPATIGSTIQDSTTELLFHFGMFKKGQMWKQTGLFLSIVLTSKRLRGWIDYLHVFDLQPLTNYADVLHSPRLIPPPAISFPSNSRGF